MYADIFYILTIITFTLSLLTYLSVRVYLHDYIHNTVFKIQHTCNSTKLNLFHFWSYLVELLSNVIDFNTPIFSLSLSILLCLSLPLPLSFCIVISICFHVHHNIVAKYRSR